MVPLDAGHALEGIARALPRLQLLARGAEAEVRLGEFMGLRAVFKVRVRKEYMHPRLDEILRSRRTRREARVLLASRRAGARVPMVYAVFPSLGLLVMEYVEGVRFKEYFNSNPEAGVRLSREAGRLLALIHSAGVVHGDYTTSNLILARDGLYAIDFGLADFDSSVEERATDLHLYRRSLESAHARYARDAYESFVSGYAEVAPDWRDIVERAEEIRLRGRYVEARRKSVWARLG